MSHLIPRVPTRQESTLKGLFKNISTQTVGPAEAQIVKIVVPMTFDIKKRFITPVCKGVALYPVEANAPDLDRGYSDLFRQVCGSSTNFDFGVGPVRVLFEYRPKKGQDFKRIEMGKAYELIEPTDRRHNHKDPKLADFKMMVIHETTTNVFRPTFEQMHAHLYIG